MQPSRSRTSLISLAIAAAATLAGVALPATSASAMVVDCSYIKGLGKYVESYGVTCAGGTSDGRADGLSSMAASAAGSKSPCLFNEPETPDYANSEPLRETTRSTTRDTPFGKSRYTTTKYYNRDGVLARTKTHVRDAKGNEETFFSDLDPTHAGFEIHSHWFCDNDNWDAPTFSTTFPDYTDTSGGHVTTGTTTPRAIKSLASTSTLTPVPGSSDLFLYRTDVVSTTPSPLSQITLDVGLTDFEVTGFATLPAGATCSAVYKTEECDIPDLAPGATTTLVLTVRLRPTAALATAGITTTASFKGVFPAAPRPVGAIFHLATRATAAPTPGPAKPTCDLARNVDGTQLTAEAVDANITTTLVTHCLNDAHQTMAARSEHGTVTIDGYGTLTYIPSDGYTGPDTVTVTASTSAAVGEPTSFDVNVVPAATAGDDHYAMTPGGSLQPEVGLLANDSIPVTAGWLIQQGQTPPAHGTLVLDIRTGLFTYTPDAGFSGTDTFKYRLSGHSGAYSPVATVTIEVAD